MILVLVALVMSGNGLVAPILSVYAETFSVSSTMVGMIITIFGVARLFSNIPAGFLSQRFGRKPLLCLGPAIIVIGSVGAAIADDFTTLLICRFVQGIGSGIYMTTSSAMIADLAGAEERGRIMALFQAGILFGAGIGPAIGGLLAQHFGMTAPFWAYALVCSGAVFVAWKSAPETAPVIKGDKPDASPNLRILYHPVLLLLCFVNFGVFFTRTATQWQMIPLLGHNVYHLSLDVVGAAIALSTLANFVMLPMAGTAIDRHGARLVACWSGFLTAGAVFMIGTASGLPSFWGGMLLLGLAGGLSGPAVAALAADTIPRTHYGPAMGLLRTGGDLGFVLGPVLVGFLDDFGSLGLSGGLALNGFLLLMGAASLTPLIFKRVCGPGFPYK
jgi:DHA1 family multidrug resistance protein-like MFS transporter